MKTTLIVISLLASTSFGYAQPIEDAIRSAPLLDAPGSKTPLGKDIDASTVLEVRKDAEKVTPEQGLTRRVEHLETENSILLDRINTLEKICSDLSEKVKELEKKSSESSRRIIRPKPIN